jgi:hypothetical protein
LMRLADKARTSGVKLYIDKVDGRFYASSRSQPGTLHRLTGFSCTCQGFIRHSRCAHLAALHSALGWLEDDPEPEPTPISTCVECHGTGTITVAHSRWIGGSRLGFRDQWSTPAACPACGEEVEAA